ncbi:2,3-bisphosphoglycerate-dependent phosphoglycerate mutase [Pantoea sp.]|uniref:2,3-bisphosphoglycerate-dependent phosphoglycerate mutase n=1 Tax=Pantoea sp. TaxID=69393 RepID=UPI0028ACAD67|nr:2,3-bisphosphoglycerate-dependent phosphoglycerate mutase [Pantoea sp.]
MHTSTLILLRHGESQWNLENRYTGWTDVPLTPQGYLEAERAGALIRKASLMPDFVCSSVMTRCIHTSWRVLDQLDRAWLPVDKTWRLNERHYGALQGLNKAATVDTLGEENVFRWRRTLHGVPPVDEEAPARLQTDPRYRHIALHDLPAGESLFMTLHRVLPYWQQVVVPELRAGKTVLIVAHANSLRALMTFLEKLSDEAITRLHVPTGVPIVYSMDSAANVVTQRVLT